MNGEREPVATESVPGDPEQGKKPVEHLIAALNTLFKEALDHGAQSDGYPICSPELIEESFVLLRQLTQKLQQTNRHPDFITILDVLHKYLKDDTGFAIEKAQYTAALAAIDDAVFILNDAGTITFLNSAAVEMCGIEHGKALGQPIESLISLINEKTLEPCIDFREHLLQQASRNQHRCLFKAKDGNERLVLIRAEVLVGTSGNSLGSLLLFRDITEKELLEDELLKVRKLESVGLLAGGIAHNFNNILTGIITNLFMARMSVINNEEACQLIADAEKSAFKATRLTKQLLTFSQAGAPVKENVPVDRLIEETVGFSLSGSNVDYKLQFTENLKNIEADKGQIDQVLNNIIVNAAQSMPEGGTVYISVDNFVMKSGMLEENENVKNIGVPLVDGEYVKISVRDEGPGIPRKHLSKIFDPYFTTKPGCTGLGLTIAYSIITKHDGYIEVDTQLGKGTTISCYLPALQEHAADATSEIVTTAATGKVLVMDDDVIIRTVVEKLLKKSGYTVDSASNGADALALYQKAYESNEPFEFVIMDLTIPGGMGGKETVLKLKEYDHDAKVVVFSGYSNDPILTHFTEYGFDGVLKKPFSTDELLHLIKSLGKQVTN